MTLQKNFAPNTGKIFLKFVSVFLALTLLVPVNPLPVHAAVLNLPEPGSMMNLSPGFAPLLIKGVKIFPDNPLRFDFIVDPGESGLTGEDLKGETNKLIKYFLASLTIPKEDLWVNLSPYEHDRIIPQEFGVTEMGRDLLAQDYILKQITSSLMYPEDDLGKRFWENVYRKAKDRYGTTDIPVDTFNKVWIVPGKAVVYENTDTAVVVKTHLKVMLEEDYAVNFPPDKAPPRRGCQGRDCSVAPAVLREIILPEIEKEVNEGKNFAALRQIYHSMILATWFKRNLKESLLGNVYVGKNKVDGIDVEDKEIKEKIYQQYLEAFRKGVYNYIREETDPATQQVIPRKYFSGGAELMEVEKVYAPTGSEEEALEIIDDAMIASADLLPNGKRATENAPADQAMTAGGTGVLEEIKFNHANTVKKEAYTLPEDIFGAEGVNLIDGLNEAWLEFARDHNIPPDEQKIMVQVRGSAAYLTEGENQLSWSNIDDIDLSLLSSQQP